MPRQQSGTRRQNARKPGLEAAAAEGSKRQKACQKSSSAGDCHHFIYHIFQYMVTAVAPLLLNHWFISGVQQTRATRRTSVRKANTKAKTTSKPHRKSNRNA